MKLDSRNSIKKLQWQHVVHFSFIVLLVCLCIIMPIIYKLTGTPPYWGIILIFSVPSVAYIIFITLVYARKSNSSELSQQPSIEQQQQQQPQPQPQHTIQVIPEEEEEEVYQYYEDDHHSYENLTQLNNNITLLEEEDDVPSVDTRSYNPSTMGIPPSSFLAPTNNQSIRSSSLDYTPPPPAYHEMTYPPSYHSNQSIKDDTRQ